MQETSHLLLGQAGVYRVASELLRRGVNVYFPGVDNHGVDLQTVDGVRIQVKAARLRVRKRLSVRPAYYIHVGWTQQGNRHTSVRRARAYSEEVDFFVIWGVDEDRFWIVPASVFDGRYCLMLYAGVTEPLCAKATGPHTPFAAHVYAGEGRWDRLQPTRPAISPLVAVS